MPDLAREASTQEMLVWRSLRSSFKLRRAADDKCARVFIDIAVSKKRRREKSGAGELCESVCMAPA